MESTTSALPPGPAPMSLPQRILGILTGPRRVLESLRERPHLLGAVLVLLVLHLAVGILLTPASVQDQLRQLEASPNLTPEQAEQAQSRIETISRFAVPFTMVLFTLVAVFAVAGVLLAVTNVALGGNARYKTMASAVAHVSMVSIPMWIVRAPLSMVQGTMDVQTGLAALLPGDPPEKNALYFALMQFDVFGLWQLGLSVLAVAIIGRVPTRKAAAGVIGLWVVWSAIWVPLQTFLNNLGSRGQ